MSDTLFMTPEQLAEFNTIFAPPTKRAVELVDTLPIANEEKHQMVIDAVSTFGAAQLQHSFKELRGVPPEAIQMATSILISFIVSGIRQLAGK